MPVVVDTTSPKATVPQPPTVEQMVTRVASSKVSVVVVVEPPEPVMSPFCPRRIEPVVPLVDVMEPSSPVTVYTYV
jgi:hypothetical protein